MNLQQRSTDIGTEPVAQSAQDGSPLVHSVPTSPYRDTASAVVAALATDSVRGLRDAEAQRRLNQYGHNRLKSAPETPWWKRLLEQFENFLVIILLVAIVISVLEWTLQDPRETALPYEAIVILAIVILNAMLGFIQESRAEKSVRALMALAAPESTVIRDGERQRVATQDIVPGDIVLVEAGDKIPADSRLIEVANLKTDEAPLTGESVPVSKETKPIEGDVGIGDRRNMLYSGTVATYGRGRAVVVATGMGTEVGRIAGLLEAAEKEPTPLQQELDRTGKRLSVIMLGICAVVFAAGLLSTTAFTLNVVLGLFLFAVALAVAAIPEALPAIVTVGLSLGVRRMAAANAIVRKLPAVETLGAATVICSDKTGTLTRNEMTVRAIATSNATVEVGGSGYIPEGDFTVEGKKVDAASPHARSRVANAARRGARQRLRPLASAKGDGRCRAIRPRAPWWSLRASSASAWPTSSGCQRIAEIPFTSERKRHTTVHADLDNPAELRVFVKGAPEILLANCRYVWEAGKAVPLSDVRRNELLQRNEGLARKALRTLAIATRTVPAATLGVDPKAAAAGDAKIELAGDHRGRSHSPRPRRHDRPAAHRGQRRRDHRQARTYPLGDDHRRSSGDRRSDRARAHDFRTRIAPRDRQRPAHHGRCRARRHRRGRARVRARRSGAQAAHRRRAPAQGPHRRDDRRRHQRCAGAEVRQHRRRHGHHRHRRLQGSGRHGADRRQLRQHRESDRGGSRHLRQYPQIPDLSVVVERRRTAHHVRGCHACGHARAHLGRRRPVPAAACGATALDQPRHRRAAGARARRRSERPRCHGARAAGARHRRAHDRGLVAAWQRSARS